MEYIAVLDCGHSKKVDPSVKQWDMVDCDHEGHADEPGGVVKAQVFGVVRKGSMRLGFQAP